MRLTNDEINDRVDQLLEGVVKQIRVTDRTDISRASLLKLIARRAMRNSTQRLQRIERGDVSHFGVGDAP